MMAETQPVRSEGEGASPSPPATDGLGPGGSKKAGSGARVEGGDPIDGRGSACRQSRHFLLNALSSPRSTAPGTPFMPRSRWQAVSTKSIIRKTSMLALGFAALLACGAATQPPPAAAGGQAAQRGMYGGTPARNMASDATRLPSRWDPATGLNVKWTADLGSQSYGGPVVAGGKVYVGTNNQGQRNPKITGDRGVMMAFRAADGQFLWQAIHDKLSQGKVNDWPLQGICSTPAIEGNRLYYVSNPAELVCADTEGFRDGKNDGPFTAETATSEIGTAFIC